MCLRLIGTVFKLIIWGPHTLWMAAVLLCTINKDYNKKILPMRRDFGVNWIIRLHCISVILREENKLKSNMLDPFSLLSGQVGGTHQLNPPKSVILGDSNVYGQLMSSLRINLIICNSVLYIINYDNEVYIYTNEYSGYMGGAFLPWNESMFWVYFSALSF